MLPDGTDLREEPDMRVHGTLAVAACVAFSVNVFQAGATFYRIYRLQEEQLASLGQLVRNSAYGLTYLGSGICLLYLLLALRRFDARFLRLAGPKPPTERLGASSQRAVWLCTAPLLIAGGTLLVMTLLRAQYEGLPQGSWDPGRLILAAYLILAGLCAEVAVQVLRHAEAAGRRLAEGAPPRRERALFWAVAASAGLRLGGMGYFLYLILEDAAFYQQPARVLSLIDQILSLATVAAAAVAFGALSRIWGDGLAAWQHAAPGSDYTEARRSPGGGWPAGVLALGALMFVGEGINAWLYGASFFAPMAAFLMQTYVLLPWMVLRLDARRLRLAVETLAPPPAMPAPSSRRSIVWATRMLALGVVLSIVGQAVAEALANGTMISAKLVWNSFLNRDLFWFICLGSLTLEASVLEDALARLEARLESPPAA